MGLLALSACWACGYYCCCCSAFCVLEAEGVTSHPEGVLIAGLSAGPSARQVECESCSERIVCDVMVLLLVFMKG